MDIGPIKTIVSSCGSNFKSSNWTALLFLTDRIFGLESSVPSSTPFHHHIYQSLISAGKKDEQNQQNVNEEKLTPAPLKDSFIHLLSQYDEVPKDASPLLYQSLLFRGVALFNLAKNFKANTWQDFGASQVVHYKMMPKEEEESNEVFKNALREAHGCYLRAAVLVPSNLPAWQGLQEILNYIIPLNIFSIPKVNTITSRGMGTRIAITASSLTSSASSTTPSSSSNSNVLEFNLKSIVELEETVISQSLKWIGNLTTSGNQSISPSFPVSHSQVILHSLLNRQLSFVQSRISSILLAPIKETLAPIFDTPEISTSSPSLDIKSSLDKVCKYFSMVLKASQSMENCQQNFAAISQLLPFFPIVPASSNIDVTTCVIRHGFNVLSGSSEPNDPNSSESSDMFFTQLVKLPAFIELFQNYMTIFNRLLEKCIIMMANTGLTSPRSNTAVNFLDQENPAFMLALYVDGIDPTKPSSSLSSTSSSTAHSAATTSSSSGASSGKSTSVKSSSSTSSAKSTSSSSNPSSSAKSTSSSASAKTTAASTSPSTPSSANSTEKICHVFKLAFPIHQTKKPTDAQTLSSVLKILTPFNPFSVSLSTSQHSTSALLGWLFSSISFSLRSKSIADSNSVPTSPTRQQLQWTYLAMPKPFIGRLNTTITGTPGNKSSVIQITSDELTSNIESTRRLISDSIKSALERPGFSPSSSSPGHKLLTLTSPSDAAHHTSTTCPVWGSGGILMPSPNSFSFFSTPFSSNWKSFLLSDGKPNVNPEYFMKDSMIRIESQNCLNMLASQTSVFSSKVLIQSAVRSLHNFLSSSSAMVKNLKSDISGLKSLGELCHVSQLECRFTLQNWSPYEGMEYPTFLTYGYAHSTENNMKGDGSAPGSIAGFPLYTSAFPLQSGIRSLFKHYFHLHPYDSLAYLIHLETTRGSWLIPKTFRGIPKTQESLQESHDDDWFDLWMIPSNRKSHTSDESGEQDDDNVLIGNQDSIHQTSSVAVYLEQLKPQLVSGLLKLKERMEQIETSESNLDDKDLFTCIVRSLILEYVDQLVILIYLQALISLADRLFKSCHDLSCQAISLIHWASGFGDTQSILMDKQEGEYTLNNFTVMYQYYYENCCLLKAKCLIKIGPSYSKIKSQHPISLLSQSKIASKSSIQPSMTTCHSDVISEAEKWILHAISSSRAHDLANPIPQCLHIELLITSSRFSLAHSLLEQLVNLPGGQEFTWARLRLNYLKALPYFTYRCQIVSKEARMAVHSVSSTTASNNEKDVMERDTKMRNKLWLGPDPSLVENEDETKKNDITSIDNPMPLKYFDRIMELGKQICANERPSSKPSSHQSDISFDHHTFDSVFDAHEVNILLKSCIKARDQLKEISGLEKQLGSNSVVFNNTPSWNWIRYYISITMWSLGDDVDAFNVLESALIASMPHRISKVFYSQINSKSLITFLQEEHGEQLIREGRFNPFYLVWFGNIYASRFVKSGASIDLLKSIHSYQMALNAYGPFRRRTLWIDGQGMEDGLLVEAAIPLVNILLELYFNSSILPSFFSNQSDASSNSMKDISLSRKQLFDIAMNILLNEITKSKANQSLKSWAILKASSSMLRNQDSNGAISSLLLFIRSNPNHFDAHMCLVEAYRREGKFAAASKVLQKLQSSYPNHPLIHFVSSVLLLKSKLTFRSLQKSRHCINFILNSVHPPSNLSIDSSHSIKFDIHSSFYDDYLLFERIRHLFTGEEVAGRTLQNLSSQDASILPYSIYLHARCLFNLYRSLLGNSRIKESFYALVAASLFSSILIAFSTESSSLIFEPFDNFKSMHKYSTVNPSSKPKGSTANFDRFKNKLSSILVFKTHSDIKSSFYSFKECPYMQEIVPKESSFEFVDQLLTGAEKGFMKCLQFASTVNYENEPPSASSTSFIQKDVVDMYNGSVDAEGEGQELSSEKEFKMLKERAQLLTDLASNQLKHALLYHFKYYGDVSNLSTMATLLSKFDSSIENLKKVVLLVNEFNNIKNASHSEASDGKSSKTPPLLLESELKAWRNLICASVTYLQVASQIRSSLAQNSLDSKNTIFGSLKHLPNQETILAFFSKVLPILHASSTLSPTLSVSSSSSIALGSAPLVNTDSMNVGVSREASILYSTLGFFYLVTQSNSLSIYSQVSKESNQANQDQILELGLETALKAREFNTVEVPSLFWSVIATIALKRVFSSSSPNQVHKFTFDKIHSFSEEVMHQVMMALLESEESKRKLTSMDTMKELTFEQHLQNRQLSINDFVSSFKINNQDSDPANEFDVTVDDPFSILYGTSSSRQQSLPISLVLLAFHAIRINSGLNRLNGGKGQSIPSSQNPFSLLQTSIKHDGVNDHPLTGPTPSLVLESSSNFSLTHQDSAWFARRVFALIPAEVHPINTESAEQGPLSLSSTIISILKVIVHGGDETKQKLIISSELVDDLRSSVKALDCIVSSSNIAEESIATNICNLEKAFDQSHQLTIQVILEMLYRLSSIKSNPSTKLNDAKVHSEYLSEMVSQLYNSVSKQVQVLQQIKKTSASPSSATSDPNVTSSTSTHTSYSSHLELFQLESLLSVCYFISFYWRSQLTKLFDPQIYTSQTLVSATQAVSVERDLKDAYMKSMKVEQLLIDFIKKSPVQAEQQQSSTSQRSTVTTTQQYESNDERLKLKRDGYFVLPGISWAQFSTLISTLSSHFKSSPNPFIWTTNLNSPLLNKIWTYMWTCQASKLIEKQRNDIEVSRKINALLADKWASENIESTDQSEKDEVGSLQAEVKEQVESKSLEIEQVSSAFTSNSFTDKTNLFEVKDVNLTKSFVAATRNVMICPWNCANWNVLSQGFETQSSSNSYASTYYSSTSSSRSNILPASPNSSALDLAMDPKNPNVFSTLFGLVHLNDEEKHKDLKSNHQELIPWLRRKLLDAVALCSIFKSFKTLSTGFASSSSLSSTYVAENAALMLKSSHSALQSCFQLYKLMKTSGISTSDSSGFQLDALNSHVKDTVLAGAKDLLNAYFGSQSSDKLETTVATLRKTLFKSHLERMVQLDVTPFNSDDSTKKNDTVSFATGTMFEGSKAIFDFYQPIQKSSLLSLVSCQKSLSCKKNDSVKGDIEIQDKLVSLAQFHIELQLEFADQLLRVGNVSAATSSLESIVNWIMNSVNTISLQQSQQASQQGHLPPSFMLHASIRGVVESTAMVLAHLLSLQSNFKSSLKVLNAFFPQQLLTNPSVSSAPSSLPTPTPTQQTVNVDLDDSKSDSSASSSSSSSFLHSQNSLDTQKLFVYLPSLPSNTQHIHNQQFTQSCILAASTLYCIAFGALNRPVKLKEFETICKSILESTSVVTSSSPTKLASSILKK